MGWAYTMSDNLYFLDLVFLLSVFEISHGSRREFNKSFIVFHGPYFSSLNKTCWWRMGEAIECILLLETPFRHQSAYSLWEAEVVDYLSDMIFDYFHFVIKWLQVRSRKDRWNFETPYRDSLYAKNQRGLSTLSGGRLSYTDWLNKFS